MSDDTEQLLGVSHTELLGRPVGAVLASVELQAACRHAQDECALAVGAAHRVELVVRVRHQTRRVSGRVYGAGRFLVLELEPCASGEMTRSAILYHHVHQVIAQLRSRATPMDAHALVIGEIRELTGFDHVMAWSFEDVDEEDGTVVAESRSERVPSFLDVRHASLRALVRGVDMGSGDRAYHIPDATDHPAIQMPAAESLDPLDEVPPIMRATLLRQVSPSRLTSLQTLGVRACMYLPLWVRESVWGGIFCYHGAPKQVPRDIRVACELMTQALAAQLAACEQAASQEQALAARSTGARLVTRVCGRARFQDGLLEDRDALLGMVNATGAAVFYDGDCTLVGETPAMDDIARLVPWIARHMGDELFSTHALGAKYPAARAYAGKASGVLAIRIPESPASFVLWFRRESLAGVRPPGWLSDEAWLHADRKDALDLLVQGRRAWEQRMRGKARPWQPWALSLAGELRQTIVAGLARRTGDLAEADEQLRAASLLREELLSTLSHELRTPLNAIMGWAHLLDAGELSSDRQSHAAGVILRNARLQAQLVDDLLDISRLVRGTLRLQTQPVPMADVIEAAIDQLETASKAKSLLVRVFMDRSVGLIVGDPTRLQQVVWNLLSNAIKYTPRGGRVEVSLTRQGSCAEISVADTGMGISPEELPHIFERFRRGQVGASRGGLGLGLAVVRSLVELHGGTVAATSEGRGRGARFVVSLPLRSSSDKTEAGGRGPSSSTESADSGVPCLTSLHVLVVEDDEDSQELLAELLRDHGARVTAVDSGLRALAVLDQGPPDVIVSDIGMPGMDGYELIRRVRERSEGKGGQVPAIALTAYVRAQDRSRAFLAGYQAHVPKPLDVPRLLSLIVSLTGRGS